MNVENLLPIILPSIIVTKFTLENCLVSVVNMDNILPVAVNFVNITKFTLEKVCMRSVNVGNLIPVALPTVNRIHTYKRPYECTECGKSFACGSHLHYHQRVHTKEMPMRAVNAGNLLSVALTFIVIRLHTGAKFYGCRECGRFYFISNLPYP